MKLIIDISEEEWLFIKAKIAIEDDSYIDRAVANGTPIPDNATNGDVIKAMFGVKEIDMPNTNTYCVHFFEEGRSHYFFKGWWHAPYQKGGKE